MMWKPPVAAWEIGNEGMMNITHIDVSNSYIQLSPNLKVFALLAFRNHPYQRPVYNDMNAKIDLL